MRPPVRALVVVALAWWAASCATPALAGPGRKATMNVDRYVHGSPRTHGEIALTALRKVPATAPRPQATTGLAPALPATARWVAHWEAPLAGGVPREVFAAGDRLVVRGDAWDLLDSLGAPLAHANVDGGPLTIDLAQGRFYALDGEGTLHARRLVDGAAIFTANPFLASKLEAVLLQAVPTGLVFAGHELPGSPEGAGQPAFTLVQDLGFPEPLELSDGLLLNETPRHATLVMRPFGLAASAPQGTVVAVPGALTILGPDLDAKASYELPDDFTASALALGPEGRAYLAGADAKGPAFAIVTLAGELVCLQRLPGPVARPRPTLVVGPDGSAWIVAAGRLLAFAPDGTALWERKPATGAALVGVTLTAAGELVVSEGGRLLVFDREGHGRHLVEGSSRAWTTPPVVTAGGEILVGTPGQLVAFEPIERFEARQKTKR